jgi:hypothetical protein
MVLILEPKRTTGTMSINKGRCTLMFSKLELDFYESNFFCHTFTYSIHPLQNQIGQYLPIWFQVPNNLPTTNLETSIKS